MPSDVPRSNSTKKREQLERRIAALVFARQRNESAEKLERLAEDVREGRLGLLKAELHWVNEPQQKKIANTERIAQLESQMQAWAAKSVDDILREVDEIK